MNLTLHNTGLHITLPPYSQNPASQFEKGYAVVRYHLHPAVQSAAFSKRPSISRQVQKHYHPKCFSGKNKDIEEVTSKSSVKTIPINVPEYDTSASVDEDIIADIIEENKIGTLGRHKRTKRDDD